MKPRSNNDELLRFADSYLRDAFPNPARSGCPADQELQQLAEQPTQANAAVTEHISCCSPCYERYAELLEQQRASLRLGFFGRLARHWHIRRARLIWASAAALVLLCAAVVLIITRSGPKPTAYSAFSYRSQQRVTNTRYGRGTGQARNSSSAGNAGAKHSTADRK